MLLTVAGGSGAIYNDGGTIRIKSTTFAGNRMIPIDDQVDSVKVAHDICTYGRSTSLVIELPQLLVYRLDAAETITTSVPAACLRSGSQLRAEHISGPWTTVTSFSHSIFRQR